MRYRLFPFFAAPAGAVLAVARAPEDEEVSAKGRVPEYTWVEIRALRAQQQVLNARVRAWGRFRGVLKGVKAKLWEGRLTLAAAADAVYEAAQSENLTFGRRGIPELPPREAIAVALLSHLRVELTDRPSGDRTAAPLARLRGQFLSWPGVKPGCPPPVADFCAMWCGC
jgi:hypothetical protein